MATGESKYSGLLAFLEKEETLAKKIKKPKNPPKKVIEEDPKKRVREVTKQMIEEAESVPFVPAHGKKKHSTEGFNIKLLEEKLVKKMIEDHKRIQSFERPYISVSEVLNCLRSCYYFRKKYAIDLKAKFNFPYLYLKRQVGDAVHEAIQNVYTFEEVEKTVISEIYNVKGRLDGLVDSYVIDFKPSEDFRENVESKHYDQGNIYATILNTEYDYSIQKVVVVYYILNFKNMQVFVNDIDIKRGLNFLERGKRLKTHLENRILIDPIGATEKECRYCSYSKYCSKDGFKEIPPPNVKKEEAIVKPTKKIEKPKKKKSVKKKISYVKDPGDNFLL